MTTSGHRSEVWVVIQSIVAEKWNILDFVVCYQVMDWSPNEDRDLLQSPYFDHPLSFETNACTRIRQSSDTAHIA